MGIFKAIYDFVVPFLTTFAQAFLDGVMMIVNPALAAFNFLKEGVMNVFNGLKNFFGQIWDSITGIFEWHINNIISKFNGLMG
jgi:phage-related protein